MKSYVLVVPLLLALGGCTETTKSDDSASKDKSPSKEGDDKSAKATAEATPTADPVLDSMAANDDPNAFASVQVPASVTIPTEEDFEAGAEKEITPANAESELVKIEKELEAGAP